MTQIYFEMNDIAVERGFVNSKYLTQESSISGYNKILSYADRAWAVTPGNKIKIVKDRTQALDIATITIDMKELMWIMLCSKQA
jgi:hypothetical protein